MLLRGLPVRDLTESSNAICRCLFRVDFLAPVMMSCFSRRPFKDVRWEVFMISSIVPSFELQLHFQAQQFVKSMS